MSNLISCNNLSVAGSLNVSGNSIFSGDVLLPLNNISANNGTFNNINLTKINNITSQNLASLDTTSSISGQIAGSLSSANTYTDSQISTLIGSAPTLLNTLTEIDLAINSDPHFSTTVTNQIALKSGLANNNLFTGDTNTFINTGKSSALAINQTANTNDYLDIFDTNNNDYLCFNKQSQLGLYTNTTTPSSTIWSIDKSGNINAKNCNINSVSDSFNLCNKNGQSTYSESFALFQGINGNTVLNSASGQVLAFKIGNIPKLTIDVLGNITDNTTITSIQSKQTVDETVCLFTVVL